MNAIDQLYCIAKRQEARIERLEYALSLAKEILPGLWEAKAKQDDYKFVLHELLRIEAEGEKYENA